MIVTIPMQEITWKIAMVKLHEVLRNYQARLLLQVHDELVLEVPHAEWEELQPKIRETMENALPLSVPLVVDVHVGENWMEAKQNSISQFDYTPETGFLCTYCRDVS